MIWKSSSRSVFVAVRAVIFEKICKYSSVSISLSDSEWIGKPTFILCDYTQVTFTESSGHVYGSAIPHFFKELIQYQEKNSVQYQNYIYTFTFHLLHSMHLHKSSTNLSLHLTLVELFIFIMMIIHPFSSICLACPVDASTCCPNLFR